jgi:hypothetical protein
MTSRGRSSDTEDRDVTDETKRIIEINGVKMEVDLREARVQNIDTLRVGTRVKVLVKGYADSFTVHAGVVIGFINFRELPTIEVAYLASDWSSCDVKFLSLNAKTTGFEIVAGGDEAEIDKNRVLQWFDNEREKLRIKTEDLRLKEAFFKEKFASYWMPVTPKQEETV